MAESEKAPRDLSDGLMEAWLKRHPRVDERRLRARLSQAMAALYGSTDPHNPHDLEEADLDDAAALAAALTEHVHFFRQFRSEASGTEPEDP
jgi:hypothetical protein